MKTSLNISSGFLIIFIISLCFPHIISSQKTEQKFSLYFENDISVLSPEHLRIIDSIKLAENKQELDVHIKGYCNSLGTTEYNLKLSQQRAANVTALLREFTIISSQGYGELDTDAATNRRVDILVHYKSDHIAELDEIIVPPKVISEELNFVNPESPKKGDKIVIENIMFYKDTDIIKDESAEALNKLYAFVTKNNKLRFKLIGHICCGDLNNPGKDLINTRTGKTNLSEARARAVHNYLVKRGIDNRRMRYTGRAFSQPTGISDVKDRRVEIEITGTN